MLFQRRWTERVSRNGVIGKGYSPANERGMSLCELRSREPLLKSQHSDARATSRGAGLELTLDTSIMDCQLGCLSWTESPLGLRSSSHGQPAGANGHEVAEHLGVKTTRATRGFLNLDRSVNNPILSRHSGEPVSSSPNPYFFSRLVAASRRSSCIRRNPTRPLGELGHGVRDRGQASKRPVLERLHWLRNAQRQACSRGLDGDKDRTDPRLEKRSRGTALRRRVVPLG